MYVLSVGDTFTPAPDLLASIHSYRNDATVVITNTFTQAEDLLQSGLNASVLVVNLALPTDQLIVQLRQMRDSCSAAANMGVVAIAERFDAGAINAMVCEDILLASVENDLGETLDRLERQHRIPSTQDDELPPYETGAKNLPEATATHENLHGTVHGEAQLTPRQIEVLQLINKGKSNKQIARSLSLTEGTVKVHCKAIFRGLGVSNRTQAAIVMQKSGYRTQAAY